VIVTKNVRLVNSFREEITRQRVVDINPGWIRAGILGEVQADPLLISWEFFNPERADVQEPVDYRRRE
jgi:hypothetical protein